MTPLETILELLARVGASQGVAVLVNETELDSWPLAAVNEMKSDKLLVRAQPAMSVICPGCEEQCTMQVHTVPAGTGKAASFVVCDKRDDINRVEVSAGRLRQWCCDAEAVGAFVSKSLGLRSESQRKAGAGLWELGVTMGRKRSQMVCLRTNGTLDLAVGEYTVPVAELVRFGPESYSVDCEAIRQLVDVVTTGDPRYTPTNARREVRKLKTQALHERWRKEYRALKKRHPEMSEVWFARQVAKMGIAEGRSAETIRKHMKR